MLQTMRNNAQSTMAKVIIGFIVVVFALWGVESIVSIGGGEPAPIKVDGQKITESDIERAVEQQRANLMRQFGEQFNQDLFSEKFLRQSAIEQLVNEKITIAQARRLGLVASTKSIDENILSIPAFQENGRFSREQFQEVLSMNGLTPLRFRDLLSNDIVANQAQAAFALSSFASAFDAQLSYTLAAETREFKHHTVSSNAFKNKVKPTTEQLQAAYEDSKEQFRIPEQVRVEYVQVQLQDLESQVTVNDAELQAAYQQYQQQEQANEQRQASHILLETHERSLKEAKALAEQLKQRLAAGESFAALAKEYSDDLGSSDEGGDLGITLRGSFDDAFDAALYSLAEGEVSAPVETEFGVHLIRADKILGADIASFDSMKAELEQQLRLNKAQDALHQKAFELSDAAFSAQSLADVAQELGLKVERSALFTRDAGEGVAESSAVRETAFADNVLFDKEISTVIETQNSALVLNVIEHQEESYQPLAEVKQQVEARFVQQEASKLAQHEADLIAAGKDVNGWAQVSSNLLEPAGVDANVLQKAFALRVGQRAVVTTSQGFTVVEVTKVERTPWEQAEAGEEFHQFVRNNKGRTDLYSYQQWSKDHTPVTGSSN